MSATTAAVTPTPAAPAARPADGRAAPDPAERFGDRLDAAHRAQHAPARERADADREPAHATPAPAAGDRHGTAPEASSARHRDTADDVATDATGADAASLAAAMLALIGHAPAAPAAGPVAVPLAAHAAGAATGDATAPLGARPLLAPGAAAPGGQDALPMLVQVAAQGPAAALANEPKLAGLFRTGPVREEDALAALQASGVSPGALPAGAVPAPSTAHQLSIGSPVGTPVFAEELGQQIAWLGQQDVKQARIRLHPEELGPLDVSLRVAHNQVDVSFAVQHPGTVHALQQTLPQLDSLLAQHGLALGQADVGQRQQHGEGRPASGGATADPDEPLAASGPVQTLAVGLLDTFA